MNDSVIASLAEKAKQGDMQAFEQLYTEFSPLVYSILFEITHDAYEAENLTQDCFVSVLKNIHTLKEPEKTKKWLTAIAANHGRDYLKKKKPALLGAEHEYIFEIKEEDDTSLLPEVSTELDERSEEIREIVNSVSEDKRLCLVLFYQHEMSIAEISEELGISESAVKTRLYRAREDIKEEVEKRNKKGMPLFGVAPLPLILFALRKSSEAASTSFAGSAAQATAFAAVTATANTAAITAASTATVTTATGTATATAATATATATGTAAAATGISVKVIAIAAAGAVAVGGGAVGAKVVHNRRAEETTTAIIEESTELASENIAVAATEPESETQITFENTTITVSTSNGTTALTVTTDVIAKTTAANNTTNAVTTSRESTAAEATTTTKPTATAKPTTTAADPTTTAKSTATEPATAATTTAATTTKPTTTTTTKPTTTAPTTTAATPATVMVTVWSSTGSTTKTLSFEPGETITADVIESRLSDEYGIEALVDAINITAESGGSYSATAYE